ncbi:Gp19/Gp15/Gp42 family protein [Microbacterium sp. ZXX196]|uniref:Gp19/Gp15/Gp42 family protein n=1 Tax=Microbacterium sp. ZXX196 TaxID=2609291 RepID=UPI0012B7F28E|nr:Gp19/Gp15/Gp42 family protein [Microbacterium sp. ZXX196]MTE24831.1 hypothetical protein [Microbacterium sp. ZXX196]
MAYADVSDLVARWRPLSAEETSRAEVLLDDAAVRLDAVCPVSDPPTDQELSARLIVSCEMVKRAMLAGSSGVPAGVTSFQQGAGPYQETQQFANPTGDLYLSKSDKALLQCGRQRAFTVPLSNEAEYVRPWGVV